MVPIELRPHNGGPAIVGNWNARGMLYLMGQGGMLQWSGDLTEGAMPLAVAFRSQHNVVVAPVHALCHVESNASTIRLGTETFDVYMKVSNWRRIIKGAVIAGILILTLACGWWLHGLATSPFPVVAQSQDEMYVF